ncbi:uncharacterized protein TNCV_2192361 [Trichonephila clavipes]|nr:uncharacterized protein TNCV_2192361 [Trichonephila clavipes]
MSLVRSNLWMPNSPSQMTTDMLIWRKIWGSGRPRKGSNKIESGFVAKDDQVPFRCSPVSSCAASLETEAAMGGRHGRRDLKCPSARRLHMVREDTDAPSEGATCAWMAADEAVGCTLAFLKMWWPSRRLVCRRRPKAGLRVNDISRIYCGPNTSSQHNQIGLIDELLA